MVANNAFLPERAGLLLKQLLSVQPFHLCQLGEGMLLGRGGFSLPF